MSWPISKGVCVGVALVLLAFQTATVEAQPQPAASRDTVVIGMGGEPDNLNPIVAGSVASSPIFTILFLVDVQRDDKWRPFAQGVEALPNLKDGTWKVDGDRMVLLWRIKGRSWHDGRPVTCGDYVFAWNSRVRHRQQPEGYWEQRIASVTCPNGAGGREITVAWKRRYVYANLAVLPITALPRHLLEREFRASPERWQELRFGNDPSATIGDGAYRLVEWRRNQSLTLESVGTHPILGTPKIKRITWRFFSDRNAMMASMLSGEIDVVSLFGLGTAAGIQLAKQAGGHFKVHFAPSAVFEHIDFNLDAPLLADLRVRRAIAHAINRIQIVQQLFEGKNPIAHTYLAPLQPGYTDAVARYPYDPARGKALLLAAGFSPGADGIMRNASGQRLALEFNTTAGNPLRERVALLIQQQLQQVGIEVTIQNFPPRVFFGEVTGRRRFKAMAMYAWVFGPIPYCDPIYTSEGVPTESNRWAGDNIPGFRNVEMDQVCKAADEEFDEEKRRALLRTSARILARELPVIPLYHRYDPFAVKAGLENVSASPGSEVGWEAGEAWNAHTWYWR